MRILTFDIEEWFHILNHAPTKTEKQWQNFESRIKGNTERILSMLHEHQQQATFFIIAWIAEKYPEVVRDIIRARHEIGIHTYSHQLIFEQDKKSFREDIHRASGILSDIAGEQVKMYRAAGFSIRRDTLWALDVLMEEGIEIDSSVFPVTRLHGGFQGFPSHKPCIIHSRGMELKEFPVNTTGILGWKFVFSGGGYFRTLPYAWIRRMTRQSDYVMTYFHPRDFDVEQPLVPDLPLYRKFMSYYGIKDNQDKLVRWLKEFDFTDISTSNREIIWEKQPKIDLNELRISS